MSRLACRGELPSASARRPPRWLWPEDAQQEAAREEVQAHVGASARTPGTTTERGALHGCRLRRGSATSRRTCSSAPSVATTGGCDWFVVDVDRERRSVAVRLRRARRGLHAADLSCRKLRTISSRRRHGAAPAPPLSSFTCHARAASASSRSTAGSARASWRERTRRSGFARGAARRRRRAARLRVPPPPPRPAARGAERLEAGRARRAGGALPRRRRLRRADQRARHPGRRDRPGRACTARTSGGCARCSAISRRRPTGRCLVDGFRLGPTAPTHRAVVDGDTKSAAIAAASIVAKVTRDRLMRRLDALYPRYGFVSHVGYITPDHSAAVRAARAERAAPHVVPGALLRGLTCRRAGAWRSGAWRGTTGCAATASSARTSGPAATSST